jgi:hypothetical protein
MYQKEKPQSFLISTWKFHNSYRQPRSPAASPASPSPTPQNPRQTDGRTKWINIYDGMISWLIHVP